MDFLSSTDTTIKAAYINGIFTAAGIVGTVIIAALTLYKTTSSERKRRFIDAISMQRIEWINNLRKLFVDYDEVLSSIHASFIEIEAQNDESISVDMYIKLKEDNVKLLSIQNNIELFLNPNEFFSKKLSFNFEVIIKMIEDDVFGMLVSEVRTIIYFIEQVILKSEWKRIKAETKKGRQLNDREMALIFHKVAIDISPERYKLIQEGEEWAIFQDEQKRKYRVLGKKIYKKFISWVK